MFSRGIKVSIIANGTWNMHCHVLNIKCHGSTKLLRGRKILLNGGSHLLPGLPPTFHEIVEYRLRVCLHRVSTLVKTPLVRFEQSVNAPVVSKYDKSMTWSMILVPTRGVGSFLNDNN